MSKKRYEDDDVMIDTDGRPGKMPAAEVGKRVIDILEDDATRPVMVIAQAKNGDLAVQVFGPPSQASLELLEQAVEQYRLALKHRIPVN